MSFSVFRQTYLSVVTQENTVELRHMQSFALTERVRQSYGSLLKFGGRIHFTPADGSYLVFYSLFNWYDTVST